MERKAHYLSAQHRNNKFSIRGLPLSESEWWFSVGLQNCTHPCLQSVRWTASLSQGSFQIRDDKWWKVLFSEFSFSEDSSYYSSSSYLCLMVEWTSVPVALLSRISIRPIRRCLSAFDSTARQKVNPCEETISNSNVNQIFFLLVAQLFGPRG